MDQPGDKADHLPQSSAEVKNEWRYTSAAHIHLCSIYSTTLCSYFCLFIQDEDNALCVIKIKVNLE
jgi:hypothetical protein